MKRRKNYSETYFCRIRGYCGGGLCACTHFCVSAYIYHGEAPNSTDTCWIEVSQGSRLSSSREIDMNQRHLFWWSESESYALCTSQPENKLPPL